MERLQKVIAKSGLCSRRKAEELIKAGKVSVNGQIVTELGTKVHGDDDIIVNGQKLVRAEKVYYLINKPKGVISSAKDEHDRKTVVDLIECDTRLYPVGRLDYDTSGALILTNDGEFTNIMIHPRYHVPKTYEVNCEGLISDEDISNIQRGFSSSLGSFAPAKIYLKGKDYRKKRSYFDLTLYEGQNHQVKNMMEALGLKVRKLHRKRFAGLSVEGMKPGEYRKIKPFEVREMKRKASTK